MGRRLALLLLGLLVVAVAPLGLAGVASASLTEFTVPAPLNSPDGIATGPDGALWFTDAYVNQIGKVTTGGSFANFDGLTAHSQGNAGPLDITAGPDGRLWFTEFDQSKIGAITTAGVVTEYSTGITANAGPRSIVTGPDGRLWFTELKAGKIGAITTAGAVTEYPLPEANSEPFDITVGPDNALWFTEKHGYDRMTTDGTITRVGTTESYARYGAITSAFGWLWMAQSYYNQIARYEIENHSLQSFGPALNASGAADITGGPDGAIWFTDPNSNFIGRMRTDGFITNTVTPPTRSEPDAVVVGPDDALWFTERFHKIGRLTTEVPPPPTLEVRLKVSPPSDPSRFDLSIEGASGKSGAADSDTTGKQVVSVEHHWIQASGPIEKFSQSITCKDGGGSGTTVATIPDYRLWVPVASASDVVCTIELTRRYPPTDLQVSQNGGFVTASWSLPPPPPDMLTGFLEFSPTPDTDALGFFADPDSFAYEFDSADTEFDSTPETFPPGTYFVHVSAFDPAACDAYGYCDDQFSSPPVKLVVPATQARFNPPAARPPAPALVDKATTFSALRVQSRQKVGKLYVQAAMTEPGTIAARGLVKVGGRSYKTANVSAPVVSGLQVRLRLKLGSKALAAVRRALKRHRKVTAKITITATDAAGNAKQERRTVRLRL